MNSYSQITWRYLKQNKKRTILTTIGIIIAISLFSGIATFMFSIQQGLIEQKRQQNGDWEFQFCNLNLDKVSKIKNNFEVNNYSVETKKDKLIIKDGKNKWITFIKSDYDSLNLVFPTRNLEGKIPTNSSEIIMSKNTKRLLNKNIGDIITIGKNGNLKNYKIVGFDKDLVSGEQIIAKTYLDSSKLKEGELYNLSVNLKEKKDKRAIAKKIGNRLDVKIAWECEDENYKTKSYVICNDGLLQVMGQSVNQMFNGAVNGLIIIVISIIIICTVAVIYNAFNISVAERINEFGILRSIGATPGKIKKLVLQEALFMGAIAIPIGIIAGYMGIYTTVYILSKSKNFIFNSMMHVGFYPQIILVSFVLGVITILLSVFGPAISASRIAPIDAIRNSSNIKKEKLKRRRAFLTKAIFGIEGDIAYKNIRRNNKRFLITIFSLVVSVVMFNTFTAYTHVFKGAAKNVIEDVNYEGMIYSFNAKSSISSSFINELKNRNEIKEVGSIINANDLLCIEQKFINDKYYKKLGKKIPKGIKIGQNQYVNIPQVSYCAYDSSALKEAKKYLIEGTIDETSLNNGGVLLVDTNKSLNKQSKKKVMDRLLKYKVGDQIKIPRIDGILHGENRGNHDSSLEINSQIIDKRSEKAIKDDKFITVKVVGILSKDSFKGTFQGEHASLIFSMRGFNKKLGKYPVNKLVFKFKDGIGRENIQEYLTNRCKELRLNYHDVYLVAEKMNSENMQVSIFIYGFITLITFIGIVNIINIITMGLLLRKSEFATMLSIGMGRKQLGKMIILEGILHGFIASIFGSAISYGVFKLMMDVQGEYIDVSADVPIGVFIIGCVGTILITLMASLIPLRKLKSMSIVENMRAKE